MVAWCRRGANCAVPRFALSLGPSSPTPLTVVAGPLGERGRGARQRMVQAGQRVTWGSQVGLVLSVDGPYADVVFAVGGTRTIPVDEIEELVDDPGGRLAVGQLGPSTAYRLALRAAFLRHAYRFDPLAGLSNARVEPKHHQVYVAHRVTRKPAPRMILADEVGLGKTIEAGLILKELRAREAAERTLILVPANLATQWQQELRVKFNEDFTILDGDAARHLGRDGGNPFETSDSIIASLAFASREQRIQQIMSVPWDLVIFDEAHRVRLGKSTRTRAYNLAEGLWDHVPGVLLLSATPMQLGVLELWGLIDLVEPGLYPSPAAYEAVRRTLPHLNELMRAVRDWTTLDELEQRGIARRFERQLDGVGLPIADLRRLHDRGFREEALDRIAATHPLAEVLVRNRRADVGGFTQRQATRILVDQTPEEEDAREAVTAYLRQTYNLAEGGNSALGFLLVTYHKMLASSSAAIYASLRKRRERLRDELEAEAEAIEQGWSEAAHRERLEVLEMEDSTEGLEGLRARELALETEILELDGLLARLGKLRDSKARQLVELVDQVLHEDPTEKVLIFTQFRETQRLLEAALRHRGYSVELFHGGMRPAEKDAAVEAFRRRSQVLVSTEAGGEGRNLQFCHVMFNFDLPWNPMRVEQRIGRIDRIGQTKPVRIVNLAVAGTVEERVLEVLSERIRLFEESIGSLDPILGDLESDIEGLVLLPPDVADAGLVELGHTIEQQVRQAQVDEESWRDFALERNSFRRDETNRLLNRRSMATHRELADFVDTALAYEGGSVAEEVDGRLSITLSPALRRDLRAREARHVGTFDPGVAVREESWDFFAMGHELVDGLLDRIAGDIAGRSGARTTADAPAPIGVEVVYELEVAGSQHAGRLVRHVVDASLSVRSEPVTRQFDGGELTEPVEVPPWTADALSASRRVAQAEMIEMREEMLGNFEDLRAGRLARLERVHDHRVRLLERAIDRRLESIAELEQDEDESRRRILPALNARVAKDRGRIVEFDEQLVRDIAAVRAERQRISFKLLAAGLVKQP